jgi:hypothetical protein
MNYPIVSFEHTLTSVSFIYHMPVVILGVSSSLHLLYMMPLY